MSQRTYNNLSELLDGEGYESPWHMGRSIYKYTDCGPWIEFLTPGVIGGSFGRQNVYYGSPAACGYGPRLWGQYCAGIRIGSIVEGSDAEARPVNLLFPFTHADLWRAVDAVNAEACELWEEANTEENEYE